MTWTYTPEDITTDRKDEVRMMVGDTDETDPLLQDEEIALILTQHPPKDGRPAWLAAAHACDAIAGKFGRRAQRSVGALSISANQQWEHYRQMAADMRLAAATNGKGNSSGFAGVTAASPILSGGGRTYLGGTSYANPDGSR